jgi:cobalt transporter subunit CbtA
VLKRIVVAAALAGLIAGLLLTAIQHFQITPLIRKAEALETSAHAAPPSVLATTAANVTLATGFALLLGAALSLRAKGGWRTGLLWGAAGYCVFFVAPSVGLPPELPGTQSAALHERELWWVGTVALSGAGLWVAAFAGKPWLRILGLALLFAPHLVGAPQPAAPAATAPAELTRDFIRAAYVANAILWLSLGGLVGHFWRGREESR